MPRRAEPDPLAKKVGARIRALRKARALTAEKLAYASELGSKGYLSDIESGLASPSMQTLQKLAEHLEVELVDLFTFPEEGARHELIDATRHTSKGDVRKLLQLVRSKAGAL